MLQPLVISAPFGNYVQPPGGGATATLGTFTALRRPGRLLQIIRTVRYAPRMGAWVNKLGLRNPGIDWLTQRVQAGKVTVADKLVSIHGLNDDEWRVLLEKAGALKPLGIELNMSCPNIGHINWPPWLFAEAVKHAAAAGVLLIVKLPPVNYRGLFRQALGTGVGMFHCCNTLPVPAGGVSGKPLKPVALQCIADVRSIARAEAPDVQLTIIGGGGITTPADIDDYAEAGATHFAIGTKCFNPGVLFGDGPLRPLIERAAARQCE